MIKFEVIGQIINFSDSAKNFKTGPTKTGKPYKNIVLNINYLDSDFKRTKKKGWLRAWNNDAEILLNKGHEKAWIFAEVRLERNKDNNGTWHDDWIIQRFHLFDTLIADSEDQNSNSNFVGKQPSNNTESDSWDSWDL